MNKKGKKTINALINVFVIIVIFLALFFGGRGIDLVTDIFSRILISLLYSMVAGAIVGLIPLPQEWGNVNILGFRFNLLVAVLTFIVKLWLF